MPLPLPMTGRRSGGNLSADSYPMRPLFDESRAKDYRFTIEWIVELEKPDVARRAEDRSNADPTGPNIEKTSDEPEPAEPEPPADQDRQAAVVGRDT